MRRALTKEEVNFYHDNGYLVVEGAFSSEECDRILKVHEERADENFKTLLNLDRELPELRDVMKDPGVVAMLEALQGAEVVGLMSQLMFKRVGSPYATEAWNAHQDNSYPQAKAGAYITINIFLADADPENGCLYAYAGSHQEGLFPFEPVISYQPGVNSGNKVKVPEKYRKVDLRVGKGGMLFLHGDLVHGSYPNKTTDRSRPLYSCCYITKGEAFNPGRTSKKVAIPLK